MKVLAAITFETQVRGTPAEQKVRFGYAKIQLASHPIHVPYLPAFSKFVRYGWFNEAAPATTRDRDAPEWNRLNIILLSRSHNFTAIP